MTIEEWVDQACRQLGAIGGKAAEAGEYAVAAHVMNVADQLAGSLDQLADAGLQDAALPEPLLEAP